MTRFNTKAEMIEAYALKVAHSNMRIYNRDHSAFAGELRLGRMVAGQKPVYNPIFCNLGYYIKGFGYSTEREARLAPEARRLFLPAMEA